MMRLISFGLQVRESDRERKKTAEALKGIGR